jgi:hypothetical protein
MRAASWNLISAGGSRRRRRFPCVAGCARKNQTDDPPDGVNSLAPELRIVRARRRRMKPSRDQNAMVFVPSGNELRVNSQTGGDQFASDVAALSNGGFVVVWDDRSGTLGDASGDSIKA